MKNKFLGLICLLYSIIIIYVWFFGYLDNYLAPNIQIYLKISLIPMIIMGIFFIFMNFPYKFKLSDILLLLPLIMIICAGDGNLSTALASNKMMKINRQGNKSLNEVVNKNINNNDIKVIENEKKDEEEIFFDVQDSVYSYLADYITYMSGSKKFIGKTIRVRGFVVDYSEYLADGYSAIGKYSITCCAADAEFAGFVIKYDFSKLKVNSWYEVEGVLELAKDAEGYDIVVINPKSVVQIFSNEKQYVYSCNNYGDGSCSDLLKYDFEY